MDINRWEPNCKKIISAENGECQVSVWDHILKERTNTPTAHHEREKSKKHAYATPGTSEVDK